jgi:hypothetical protein
MNEKVGRNDPCPCGSGKKYKNCCLTKSVGGKPLKFKAKVLSQPKAVNLMDRTFGDAIESAKQQEKPPAPLKKAHKKESTEST